MTDREFALEAVRQLVPETTYLMNGARDMEDMRKNIKLLTDMVEVLLWELKSESSYSSGATDVNKAEVAILKQGAFEDLRDSWFKDLEEER